jgi:hypothetical protein
MTQTGRSQSRKFLELEKTPRAKSEKYRLQFSIIQEQPHSLFKKTLSEIRRLPSTSRNNPARFAVFSREISITGEAT